MPGDADALRSRYVRVEVVADHPCVFGLSSERSQRREIGSWIWLAVSSFALDLNVVDTPLEIEASDLCALRRGRTIGHQPDAPAPATDIVEHIMSVVEQVHPLFSILRKACHEAFDQIVLQHRPAI
jgi:hypothetical protein